MRKLVYIFITLLTGYMAGVFRSAPLMALAGMETVLFAMAFFQSRYLKRHLSAEVLRHGEAMEKSAWLVCRVKIKNTGRLPVSRFQVRLSCGYCREAASGGGREKGKRQRKAGFRTKYIDGSCGKGESIVQFEVAGKYCGIMELQMSRLRVYDYLMLFSATRKMHEAVEVAVYPREAALCLELPSIGEGASGQAGEQMFPRRGDAGNEVRQLREYRPGDSSRYIHWNQTARTGQLWVKEYEREADTCTALFLDMDGMEEAGEAETDAYYELLSALVLGLLKQKASVRVNWYDAAGRMEEMEAGNREQCRELLLRLYRRGCREPGEAEKTVCGPGSLKAGDGLKLDMQLRLYRNDVLLFRFSADGLGKKISEGGYVL